MISTQHRPIDRSSERGGKTYSVFKEFCRDLWFIPVIAAIAATLILVIEHAHSRLGIKFLTSFTYAILIGFPCALCLNWLGLRFTGRFPRLVFLIHTAALLIIATAGSFIGAFLLTFAGILPPNDTFGGELRSSLPVSLVITLVVGLSITAYETLRHRLQDATIKLRTQQMEQERAKKLLAEARLSSLESRIHPHFLFNTLNSISSLIPTDPKRAEDTVGKLASLLRFSISANQSSLVPLDQEMKIVRDYLEIESTRFGRRLQYTISVPDGLGNVKIPPLALQTLVENSIKHVVSRRNEPASIRITAQQLDGICEVSVADDGPGFSLAEISPDHGLGNLIGRLEFLFGDAAQLNVQRLDNGVIVVIKIPRGDVK